MSDIWNDKKVADLKYLWWLGYSAREIALRLGDNTTRASVIGKAHRLGLLKRGQEKPVKSKYEKADASDLTISTCQFPIGEVGEPGFHFCGSKKLVSGTPYCMKHCRVCYPAMAEDEEEFPTAHPIDEIHQAKFEAGKL